jgi:hypothetical protein
MAGLVPAIHVFDAVRSQDVDARDKRGHDDNSAVFVIYPAAGCFAGGPAQGRVAEASPISRPWM